MILVTATWIKQVRALLVLNRDFIFFQWVQIFLEKKSFLFCVLRVRMRESLISVPIGQQWGCHPKRNIISCFVSWFPYIHRYTYSLGCLSLWHTNFLPWNYSTLQMNNQSQETKEWGEHRRRRHEQVHFYLSDQRTRSLSEYIQTFRSTEKNTYLIHSISKFP